MLTLNLIQHCANILGEILDFLGPADVKLSNYFREHGELGQKDRAEIAECIYGIIRRLRFLKKINEDDNNYKKLVIAWLIKIEVQMKPWIIALAIFAAYAVVSNMDYNDQYEVSHK